MRRATIILIVIVALVLIVLRSSLFIVDERKQALVLQFGQVRQVVNEPGLGFKLPIIQNVAFYEDRILPLETTELEVTPLDERRLVVDAFARWRIADVVRFRQAAQTEEAARSRLRSILNASLREVLGSVPSADVLSPERTVLMARIRDSARRQAEALGVEIIDVRIRQADLPEQNLEATFRRMNAERQREAFDERARGEERALEVRSKADREALELVSDAERRADIIRGQADAERNRVFAEAFGRDPEFFAFYRSLSAYEAALKDSTMVITPDSEFFEYLKNDTSGAGLPAPFGDRAASPANDSEAPASGTRDDAVAPPEGETEGGAATDNASDDDSAAAPAATTDSEPASDGGATTDSSMTSDTSDDTAAPAPADSGNATPSPDDAANDNSAPSDGSISTTIVPSTGTDN